MHRTHITNCHNNSKYISYALFGSYFSVILFTSNAPCRMFACFYFFLLSVYFFSFIGLLLYATNMIIARTFKNNGIQWKRLSFRISRFLVFLFPRFSRCFFFTFVFFFDSKFRAADIISHWIINQRQKCWQPAKIVRNSHLSQTSYHTYTHHGSPRKFVPFALFTVMGDTVLSTIYNNIENVVNDKHHNTRGRGRGWCRLLQYENGVFRARKISLRCRRKHMRAPVVDFQSFTQIDDLFNVFSCEKKIIKRHRERWSIICVTLTSTIWQ